MKNENYVFIDCDSTDYTQKIDHMTSQIKSKNKNTKKINKILKHALCDCYIQRTPTTFFFYGDLEFVEMKKIAANNAQVERYSLQKTKHFFFSTLKTKTKNPVSPRKCRSEIN